MTEEAILLGTRQISQVKIVSEIGLIWIIILTKKDCDFKKKIIFVFSQYFSHIFKKYFFVKMLFLNFSKFKMHSMSISIPPNKWIVNFDFSPKYFFLTFFFNFSEKANKILCFRSIQNEWVFSSVWPVNWKINYSHNSSLKWLGTV